MSGSTYSQLCVLPIFGCLVCSQGRLASLLTLDGRNAAYVHAEESSARSETVAVYSAEDNNLPYDVVVQRIRTDTPEHQEPSITVESVPESQIIPENYRIQDAHLGEGGPEAKFRAIYETIKRIGFTTGNILEPAMGVGNFFEMLPESMSASHLYGVELDSITGNE